MVDFEDETLKVVHVSTLQKISNQIKALIKSDQGDESTPEQRKAVMNGFLIQLRALLRVQTDALMTKAVKGKIDGLTETCTDHLQDLAAEGVYSAGFCAELNEICIYFMRRQREPEACRVAAIFKHLAFHHKDLRENILHLLGLTGCVALKSNMKDLAGECVDVILACMHDMQPGEEEDENVALQMLQNIGAMAGRMRDEALFAMVMKKVREHYLLEKQVLVGTRLMSFLLDMMFVASDRRYLETLSLLMKMSSLLIRKESVTLEQKKGFLREWGILAAQMAKRNWYDVTKLLHDGICVFLSREKDLNLTKEVMANFALHFVIHARWDGFANAFKMYHAWHNFQLTCLDQCVRSRQQEEKCFEGAACIFCNMRDTVTNVARITMKEEREVYREWLDLWLEETKGNVKRQKRLRRFVQMTAQYWHMTQPASSSKQWPYMRSIFEPSVISPAYWQLLKESV